MEINEIYKTTHMSEDFCYVGTLRNEKRFSLGQDIFFVYGKNQIAKSHIIGIELPPKQNADLIYKIKIPKRLIQEGFYSEDIDKITLTCEYIFTNTIEAKQSALTNAKRMYELELNKIENYFNQFNNR